MDSAEAIAWAKANPDRVVVGLWAINFLFNITEILTFKGQGALSLALAAAAIFLIARKTKNR